MTTAKQALNFAYLKSLFTRFIAGFMKHDVMTLAAALAFYTALSLAPLVLLVVSAVGLLGGDSQADFLTQARNIMGSQASEGLELIVKNANQNPSTGSIAGIIGILTLLFSASAVFGQLQSSLNVIWEAEAKSDEAGWISYLRKRFFSMGMVLALAFLAVVSLLLSTILGLANSSDSAWLSALNVIGSIVIFSFVFGLIFKYLPDIEIEWSHVLAGGFFTAVLFSIGRSVIGLYLSASAIGSAYGAAGSLIVFLAWVYYSAIIVFAGAEFTKAAFMVDKKGSSNPKPIAEALK